MIAFNDLRISDNKSQIILDIEIEDTETYPEMYIDGIYLEYYKNFNETTVYSEKALKVYEYVDGEIKITSYANPINQSELSLNLNGVDTFDKGLFYLIVRCVNGEDSYVDIGAVLDWQTVYALGMMSVANFASSCRPNCATPDDFENFVLTYHALSLILDTGDLLQLSKIWDRFIKLGPGIKSSFNCNCG